MKMKKHLAIALSAVLLMPTAIFGREEKYGSAKNVILMIPDGMSVEIATGARWLNKDYSLTMDSMVTGLVRTNNANTPIADSAPAASAMATGIKTESPFISSYPSEAGLPGAEKFDESKAYMPLATVLEGAKRSGRSTGIVSTSNVQHATPADFSSHHPNRNEYEILGEQQVYQDMDVVLGAGSTYLDGAKRKDKEDLISEIKGLGYDYVTNRDGMKASTGNKIWGMFDEKSFPYDLDRDQKIQPSLEEMTDKALSILSKNDKGFFVMIEGSEVDWGAHANDPVATLTETLAFDRAVKKAKDFVDKTPDTVLVIAADHGTGGMTYGHRNISSGYDKQKLEAFTHILSQAKMTGQKAASLLNEKDGRSNIQEVFKDAYGITDLTPEEINLVKTADKKNLQTAIGKVVSDRSHIGWTTGGHVGGDIALYCYTNTDKAKKLAGSVFNSEIGRYMEDVLDLDLDNLTNNLYKPARKEFEALGAKVDYVKEGQGNFALKVTKGDKEILLPVNKNYALVAGKKVPTGGLTLNSTKTVYVPQGAIDLVK